MLDRKWITGARVDGVDVSIYCAAGHVVGLGAADVEPPDDVPVTDVTGLRISRGLVDHHHRIMPGPAVLDPDAIAADLTASQARGISISLLALGPQQVSDLVETLATIAGFAHSLPGFQGVHLDGALLTDSATGAVAELGPILEAGDGLVRCVTLDPELPRALERIDELTDAGIRVAVGSKTSSYDLAAEAFDRGANMLSHPYSDLPAFAAEQGPLRAALERSKVVIEVRGGVGPVGPATLRTLFDRAPGRVALATASGFDGPDCSPQQCVLWAVGAGIDVDIALAAASTVPAAALGIDTATVGPGTPCDQLWGVDPTGALMALPHAQQPANLVA